MPIEEKMEVYKGSGRIFLKSELKIKHAKKHMFFCLFPKQKATKYIGQWLIIFTYQFWTEIQNLKKNLQKCLPLFICRFFTCKVSLRMKKKHYNCNFF